jgi:hypothetical protein
MKVRRRFLLALVASILLHLGIVTAPGWYLPSLDEFLHPKKQPQSLDAWLIRPAGKPLPAPAPRPARPRPRPGATVVPQTPVSESAPEPVPTPEVQAKAEASGAESATPGATEAASKVQLPFAHLRIQYAVTMGEGGLVIGQAVQEFQNDGVTYLLRSTTGTTGLARLFKRVDLVHTSEGEVVDDGLRPREFRIERDGAAGEWAMFDWEQGQVTLSDGQRRFQLKPGAQDMLSMFCQLGLIPISGPSVSLPVVTGKKVENYEFTVVGEERLSTPMGEQPTLHLRTLGTGSEATDVWLGLHYARLPLRIRHVDRKGEVFDQVAGSIEIEPITERPH